MTFNLNPKSLAIAGLAGACAVGGVYYLWNAASNAAGNLLFGDFTGPFVESTPSQATQVFRQQSELRSTAAHTATSTAVVPHRGVVRLTATRNATTAKSVQSASQALSTSQSDGTVGAYLGPQVLLTASIGKTKFSAAIDLSNVPSFASLLNKPGTFELNFFLSSELLPQKKLLLKDSEEAAEDVSEEEQTQQAVTAGSVFNLIAKTDSGEIVTGQLPLNDVFPEAQSLANESTPWKVDVQLVGKMPDGYQISVKEDHLLSASFSGSEEESVSFDDANSETSSLASSHSSLPARGKKRLAKRLKNMRLAEIPQRDLKPKRTVYRIINQPNPSSMTSTSSTSSTGSSNVGSSRGTVSNVKSFTVVVKKIENE